MKNADLGEILRKLDSLGNLKGVKFCHAVSRNKAKLLKKTKEFAKAAKPYKEFEEFQNKTRELFLDYALKDEKGAVKVVVENGQRINKLDPEKKEEYEAAVVALKDEYTDAVEAREKQMEEYNEFMEEEVDKDFSFYMVKMENVPEDINCSQMDAILPFLEEEVD